MIIYKKDDEIRIRGVLYTVVRRSPPGEKYRELFPGRCGYTLKRKNGSQLYYVTHYENDTWSKPIGMAYSATSSVSSVMGTG